VAVITVKYRLLFLWDWLDFHLISVTGLFWPLLLPKPVNLMPPICSVFPLLFHSPRLQYPVVV
jgi:hypothetical protein